MVLSTLVVGGVAFAVTMLVNVEVGGLELIDMLCVVRITDVLAFGNPGVVLVRF